MFSSFFSQTRKVCSAIPIFGAVFAEKDRLAQLTQDTCQFGTSALLMTLLHFFTTSSMDSTGDMDMNTMQDMSTMYETDSDGATTQYLLMFMIMYLEMRTAGMIGELIGNILTSCCKSESPNENRTWRDDPCFKIILTPLPLGIGNFVKTGNAKKIVELTIGELMMYTAGTLAMMWPGLNSFSNQYIDWIATLARMYSGMSVAMVGHSVATTIADSFFQKCCAKEVIDEEMQLIAKPT